MYNGDFQDSTGSGSGDTTSVTNFILNPLGPSTAYDIYVQGICASGDTSSWTGPHTFSTPILGPQGITCSSGNPGVVLSDDLESQGAWTGDFGTGNGVWRVNSGGTTSTNFGPSGATPQRKWYFTLKLAGGATGTIVSINLT